MAQAQLDGVRHLVLVDAASPVSFFAYPDKASDIVPAGCTVHTLVRPGEDAAGALEALADAVGAAGDAGVVAPSGRPDRPTGALTTESLAAAVGATLPEDTIVVDEGNTSGLFVSGATAGGPRHDWLTLTGGAIGIGLPMATGASVAAPDRPVLCLQADGSAMYTLQALWTQAREGLNVTTVLLSNRSYAILNMELHRVGADAGGPLASRLLDLTDPELDFCDLARGMGVPARRVENAEDLVGALETGFAEPGPTLIEVSP
jgi:acetolactate synthase-1/2/3 large subunit